MFTNIVWFTDLSPKAALCRAPVIALASGNTPVELVFALGALDGLRAELHRGLTHEAEQLAARGLPAQARLAEGLPEEVAARYNGPGDLVVVGRTGANALERVLLGSTANRILRHAHAPTLVVGGLPFDGLRAVLCAVDLDPEAPSPAATAASVAAEHGAALTFVNVQPIDWAEAPERARDALKALVHAQVPAALLSSVQHVRYEVGVAETPEAGLVALAEGYDLVVLGTHQRGRIARMMLGSVAEYVAGHAPVPALVVPPR